MNNKLYLLLALAIGTSFAMDNPNPDQNPGGYGYNPYGYYQPYGYPPYGYQNPYPGYQAGAQPAAYGYQQPYGYPAPVQYTVPYGYQQPEVASPIAAPIGQAPTASDAQAVDPLAVDQDDSNVIAPAAATSSAATDMITDEEQEHLDKLADNLKKITDALLGVAASYAGAGVNLATLQLGDAAGEAILATAGNVKDAGQIAWWLNRASVHFDALSKPGVSKAAQIERDKLAPTLKAFKNKFSGSPIKAIKNKFFGKKDKKDDASQSK
jgi:hypothetical protein